MTRSDAEDGGNHEGSPEAQAALAAARSVPLDREAAVAEFVGVWGAEHGHCGRRLERRVEAAVAETLARGLPLPTAREMEALVCGWPHDGVSGRALAHDERGEPVWTTPEDDCDYAGRADLAERYPLLDRLVLDQF